MANNMSRSIKSRAKMQEIGLGGRTNSMSALAGRRPEEGKNCRDHSR